MTHNKRGILAGVGLIIGAVIRMVVTFSAVLNSSCQNRFWRNLVVYPGAAVVEKQADFLGKQPVLFHSADAVDAINTGYNQQRAA